MLINRQNKCKRILVRIKTLLPLSYTLSQTTMRNQFRSKSFIKIKHSLQSCILPTHLESCRQMIENATPILTHDEIVILKEYYETAHDLIHPIFLKEWDSLVRKHA